jgi:hypothetical protein
MKNAGFQQAATRSLPVHFVGRRPDQYDIKGDIGDVLEIRGITDFFWFDDSELTRTRSSPASKRATTITTKKGALNRPFRRSSAAEYRQNIPRSPKTTRALRDAVSRSS